MPKDNTMQQVGRVVGLAFLLPTATFVGYVIGYFLDRAFHTHFLTFVFLLFGVASGVIELIRELSQDARDK